MRDARRGCLDDTKEEMGIVDFCEFSELRWRSGSMRGGRLTTWCRTCGRGSQEDVKDMVPPLRSFRAPTTRLIFAFPVLPWKAAGALEEWMVFWTMATCIEVHVILSGILSMPFTNVP